MLNKINEYECLKIVNVSHMLILTKLKYELTISLIDLIGCFFGRGANVHG